MRSLDQQKEARSMNQHYEKAMSDRHQKQKVFDEILSFE
jgi:hypothetical protein